MPTLTDTHGRTMTYLRLSVTDRCNMACTYCVPPGGVNLAHTCDLLEDDELVRLAGLFTGMGVTKIRITGGEPLLRRGLPNLCKRLKTLPGLQTLALSTNGVLLDRYAVELARAGVQAVNISLDTFDRHRFRDLTGGGDLTRVRRGIDAALSAGLKVRLNAVAARWLTDEDLESFVQLTMDNTLEVRFIEYMPLCAEGFDHQKFLPATELVDRFRKITDLVPCVTPGEKAFYYALPGGRGRLGFIASISRSFCGTCNRVRLSATGKIRPCLFSPQEVDLAGPMRRNMPDHLLRAVIRQAVRQKSAGHTVTREDVAKVGAGDYASIRSIGG